MQELELPAGDYPVLDLLKPEIEFDRRIDGIWIKDKIRRIWLKLTPEEWVRQHALHWLVERTGFPEGLISIERAFSPKLLKRADIVGFDRNGNSILLVECKAAYEPINAETARQAMQYNVHIKATFVWLTNGLTHLVFGISKDGKSEMIPVLPGFEQMMSH